MTLLDDVGGQLFSRPSYPTANFSGKTVIVTGANVNLRKEAVKHFVRLKASRVIIAVRSIAKGKAVKAEIEELTEGAAGVIEVWEVDNANYASCKEFAHNVVKLERVDAVVLNAEIATEQFEILEDNESQSTVSVVSTTLLVLLLLPVLHASVSKSADSVPVISVVSSGVHAYTRFPERKTPNSLATLNDQKTAVMSNRYQVSKLLQLLVVREMAKKTVNGKPFVIINTLDTGLCYTDLTRSATGSTKIAIKVMRTALAWTAEEGGRTLVLATTAGPESHGAYMSGGKIKNENLSKLVTGSDGEKTQKRV